MGFFEVHDFEKWSQKGYMNLQEWSHMNGKVSLRDMRNQCEKMNFQKVSHRDEKARYQ